MAARLSGGRGSEVENPFLALKSGRRSYPVRGAPDNASGASHRGGPKGWADAKAAPQRLEERRAIGPQPNGHGLHLGSCRARSQ